jgi:hypothetical protein
LPAFEKLSEKLKQQGIIVEPLSRCVDQVLQDCQSLQKKPKKGSGGPKI